MPFRLLGVVVDPDQASTLCGHTFGRYAAAGVEVTLVCPAAAAWTPSRTDALREFGIAHVVLLDYTDGELSTPVGETAMTDVMAGLRPHVVVLDGDEGLASVGVAAFRRARRGGGSSTLPAKLYSRASSDSLVRVTTRIHITGHPAEPFVRIYPSPWVTGVLESDLFAGIRDIGHELSEHRLAS